MPLRQLLQRSREGGGPEDVALLSRELNRLDPWSYWSVPLAPREPGDFVVVGTTGAFIVAACGHEGYLAANGRRLDVSGRPVHGLREIEHGAKQLRMRLGNAAVFTEVVPVICLTRAVAGAPRSVRGVRIVPLSELARDLSSGPNVLLPNRALRGAQALGLVAGRDLRPRDDDGN